MSDDMTGRGSDLGPTSSGPIKGLRPTKVIPNGEPGAYELHWGPIEKAFAGGVVTLLVLGIGGGIAMYREVGEIRAAQEANAAAAILAASEAASAAAGVAEKLERHLDYSRDIVPQLLTREEYQRDHQGRH